MSRPRRIAIDCRKISDFGIGTYIRELVAGLAELDGDQEYVLIGPLSEGEALPDDPRFRRVHDDSPGYSLREQMSIPLIVRRLGIDLFHAPHYVVPLVGVPFVVTIHDLIHLELPREEIGAFARLYAERMIGRAVKRSRTILTVSEATRERIEQRFPSSGGKITVTPPAVGSLFTSARRPDDARILERFGLDSRSYFLFVGNEKPHKNLERLLQAASRKREPLVIVGAESDRFRRHAGVVATGRIHEEMLGSLYRNARALIQPSLIEGFGLPVAEAMACGTPVLASAIPSLQEVGGDAARYFDPESVDAIADAMGSVEPASGEYESMRRRGLDRAKQFTREALARKTSAAYLDALT